MIVLTEEQRREIASHGEAAIPFIDPETRAQYVLLRGDLFKRWKAVMDDDDVRSMAPLLANLDPEDWEDASVYEGKS